jgi:hypothetical protein
MSQFRAFGLREAYGAADYIRSAIVEDDDDGFLNYFEDIFPIDADFKKMALEPQRETFLHLIIDKYLEESSEYLRSKADHWMALKEFVASLEAHRVTVPRGIRVAADRWIGRDSGDEGDDDDDHEVEAESDIEAGSSESDEGDDDDDDENEITGAAYELYRTACIPNITVEVFTLLFGDRPLLLALNERIAALVVPLKLAEHADLLERDGVVKRCPYWPEWLRRALIFRDKGHCAICMRDISNLVFVGEKGYHLDHIVALENGGTNDPTNVQLLCEACNLKKGGGEARTSSTCMVYW